jgi:hypothetical protein
MSLSRPVSGILDGGARETLGIVFDRATNLNCLTRGILVITINPDLLLLAPHHWQPCLPGSIACRFEAISGITCKASWRPGGIPIVSCRHQVRKHGRSHCLQAPSEAFTVTRQRVSRSVVLPKEPQSNWNLNRSASEFSSWNYPPALA